MRYRPLCRLLRVPRGQTPLLLIPGAEGLANDHGSVLPRKVHRCHRRTLVRIRHHRYVSLLERPQAPPASTPASLRCSLALDHGQ